ncbi:MAG TPA: hypothetical protein QF882_11415 [Arenicellales bacterium]|nr:hypothetical protein [Arenicellales bacterium]
MTKQAVLITHGSDGPENGDHASATLTNWALYGRPGAQTYDEQNRLGMPAHKAQAAWLDHFLINLLGSSGSQK